MGTILPQQHLLLELLIMSGDIAVAETSADTILAKTLAECVANGWVEVKVFGAGFNKVTITDKGRQAASG